MQIIKIPNHKAISWNKLYSQKHWRYRSKLSNEIHTLVFAMVKSQKIKQIKKYPIEVKIVAGFKDKRLRDVDNICSKLYIDGLKKSSIIEDDDYRYINKITKIIRSDENSNYIEINLC